VTSLAAPVLRRLDRASVQPHLGALSAWLLPGSIYGVQHTWPQLYRSDGDGRFLTLFQGEQLLAHCAFRIVTLRTAQGPRRIALLGSVATDPRERGRGHATLLLTHAIADCRTLGADAILLWAEQPHLYARLGFVASAPEACVCITAHDDSPSLADHGAIVRRATIADHAALCSVHAHKPTAVERDLRTMSGLLTTPGMATMVLDRAGRAAAYACIGKGADLQSWWHECGGDDADIAALLPTAMAQLGQPEAFVLVPPYRSALPKLLAPVTLEQSTVAGPMVLPLAPDFAPTAWIDGLDSV
jgi:GNAT superfamily N-acetyltransferase